MSNEDDNLPELYPHWIPRKAIESLALEQGAHQDESYTQLARRLMEENLPTVVLGTIHLALYSPDEQIRLRAQQYITDHMLGPSHKAVEQLEGGKQAWDRVFDAVLVDEPRKN